MAEAIQDKDRRTEKTERDQREALQVGTSAALPLLSLCLGSPFCGQSVRLIECCKFAKVVLVVASGGCVAR